MQICAGCEIPILDRFLLNVLDRVWHIRCVQCSDCQSPLTEKCFSRDGKLYCRDDFFIRYGTKCAGCMLGISPSDLVRRARNKVFHLKCFTCMVCRKELSTGEELYILDENKFICKEDYLASKLAGSDGEEDVDFDSVLDKQESEAEYTTESDNIDSKQDLFLQVNDNGPLNGFANQLHQNSNSLTGSNISKTDQSLLTSLPPSPIVQDPDKPIKEESMDHLSDACASPAPLSPGSQTVVTNPASNCSSMENNDSNNNKDTGSGEKSAGNKRRGPRTTIKAKQLEVLKASFNATPKPTRHIREQLAAETGLNMRVIQVWFQNRRSKERRMKQLSALGARRHFFARSPRRMRALRAGMSPSEIEESEMMSQGYGYFNDNGQEFYPAYPGPGFGEFFTGQGPDVPPGMPLLPPQGRRTPPMGMDHQGMYHGPMGHEVDYMNQPPPEMLVAPQSSSPEPLMHSEEQYLMQSLPPRSLPVQFQTSPDTWG